MLGEVIFERSRRDGLMEIWCVDVEVYFPSAITRSLIESIAILEGDGMGVEVSLSIAEGLELKEEDTPVEITIVMPCLNEAETLGICIEKAKRVLSENSIAGEVLVADNGSTDGSQEIAIRMGARVVNVAAKGYGNALMGGIAAARGKYIVMGDADDSYDFLEIPKYLEKLRQGYELVQGCRLVAGE